MLSMPASHAGRREIPEGKIVKIEFEGTTIARTRSSQALEPVGQPLNREKAEADLKTLLGTKWFCNADYSVYETPPRSGKYTLIFALEEMTVSPSRVSRRKAIHQRDRRYNRLKAGNRADPSHAGEPSARSRNCIERRLRPGVGHVARGGNQATRRSLSRSLRAPRQGHFDQLRGTISLRPRR